MHALAMQQQNRGQCTHRSSERSQWTMSRVDGPIRPFSCAILTPFFGFSLNVEITCSTVCVQRDGSVCHPEPFRMVRKNRSTAVGTCLLLALDLNKVHGVVRVREGVQARGRAAPQTPAADPGLQEPRPGPRPHRRGALHNARLCLQRSL
jgi:hypothetical protein